MSVQDRYPVYEADQRAHFDAKTTEDWAEYSEPGAVALWRYEVDLLLSATRPSTILDLGCGAGFHDFEMARRPFVKRVEAVDYSPRSIERAREHFGHPKVHYTAADFAQPGVLAGTYDLVVSFQVIEHLQDAAGFLRLCRTHCREGGRVAVFTVNRLRPYNRIRLRQGKPAVMDDPMHCREFDRAELAELGRQAGLRPPRTMGYSVGPPWRWQWFGLRLGRWMPWRAERLCALYEPVGAEQG